MFKLKLGINDCTNEQYHSDTTYLSSSVLKTILKSLEQYEEEYIRGNKPQIGNLAALQEGSLTHTMLLEPHLVDKEYAFFPGPRKAGDDWDKFVATCGKSERSILSKGQLWRVEQLVAGIKHLDAAMDLLSGGEPEQTICAILQDVPVKVRFDYINVDKGYIADIKTTGYSGEVDSFKQTVKDLMYHLSAALYSQVAELQYGKPFSFYFIVASKKDFKGYVYKLSEANMNLGRRLVSEALTKYKKAKESGIWTEKNLTSEGKSGDTSYEILEV